MFQVYVTFGVEALSKTDYLPSMKVLNICADDWANFMHGHTLALRSAGVDVTEAKLRPHVFGYSTETPVIKPSEMSALIRSADIVQIFHSSKSIANLISAAGLKGKFTVWHTGSDYRSDPDGVRDRFKSLGVVKEFTDQCEFLMIDPDLTYVTAAVDVEGIRMSVNPMGLPEEYGSKFSIGHYPSKSGVKGTEKVLELIKPHVDKFFFHHSDEKVSHDRQLSRMNNCHIYVELFQNELNGKPYGCYGVTAFEAAALGKVVITQNIHKEAYFKAYGCEAEFILANTEYGFTAALNELAGYSVHKMQLRQDRVLQWVKKHHSIQATGERMKNILFAL